MNCFALEDKVYDEWGDWDDHWWTPNDVINVSSDDTTVVV